MTTVVQTSAPSATRTRIYCSELARQGEAALYGSAVQVDIWLLIEYPRPWKPKALADNDFDQRINEHLAQLPGQVMDAGGARLRVQFIKQAASADMVQPQLMISRGDDQHQHQHLQHMHLSQYSDLLEITATDLLQGNIGQPMADSIYLVCTNGQRDLCCARFGLPLFEHLQSHLGRRVWQTTHVGGHRYAPNLLSLPSGMLYGFVSPEQALDVTRQQDEGAISLAHLRGRSCYEPAAQAAEYFLRADLPQQHLVTLQLQNCQTQNGVSTSTFQLADGQQRQVRVEMVMGAAVVASCEGEPKPVAEFRLIDSST